jgi:hypothetical protein
MKALFGQDWHENEETCPNVVFYPNNLPNKGRNYDTIEIDRGGNFR